MGKKYNNRCLRLPTDDFGVMLFGLVTIACYINDSVRENALVQLRRWFKEFDREILAEVDAAL